MNTHAESQLMKTNHIHQVIKFFQEMFPEEFEKTNIEKCKYCGGAGFKNIEYHFQNKSNICKKCKGVGYHGYAVYKGEYICRHCNAAGCNNCNYTGISDWISVAMDPSDGEEPEMFYTYKTV